jgi:4'-phosphopantetheinyl transferase
MTYIYCDTIKNITWRKKDLELFMCDSKVDIWRVSVGDDKRLYNLFHSVLSIEEKQKATNYHREKDKNSFITSRGTLRFLLGNYLAINPGDIEIHSGANKKPLLKNISNHHLHFNISHSGEWVVIAIGPLEVGVDLERINKGFSYQEIIEVAFNNEEKNFVQNSSQPEKDFYLLWTRKESLVKATAKGLDKDLIAVPSLDGFHEKEYKILNSKEAWNIKSFEVDAGYIGSVATTEKIQTINFLDTKELFFLQPV